MSDINREDPDINRSIAGFQVHYRTGIIHTKGPKKGREITEEEVITIIVPSLDNRDVQDYVKEYCKKKNMIFDHFINIGLFAGKRNLEFNCQICGELSIKEYPWDQNFCSKYCQKKGPYR